MLIVRATTRLPNSGSRVSAVCDGSRANSWYASSTTTMASVASRIARVTGSGVVVPVGLLGVVRMTTVGWCSATAAIAAAGSIA